MGPLASEMVLSEALGSGQGVIWAAGRPKRCYMAPWAAEMVLYEALGGGQGVIWTPGRPKRCYMGSWAAEMVLYDCLLYTSPSPRDLSTSRMPSSA